MTACPDHVSTSRANGTRTSATTRARRFAPAVVLAMLFASLGLTSGAGASADLPPDAPVSSDASLPEASDALSPRLPCAGPSPFSDVMAASSFCSDIAWMAARNIGGGFPDGTFRPSNPITRQAVAAFLYRFADQPPFTPPATPTFSDVGVSHPFRTEIEWLAAEGIGGGFPDGTFRPTNTITRQAIAAFLYRYDGEVPHAPGSAIFSDVPASHPFFVEIDWLVSELIAGGFADGTFRPGDDVTRQAVAAFLSRFNMAFVAVAQDGSIHTSRSGLRWAQRRNPTFVQLNDVASNHLGVWTAVGFNGTILRSPDGIRWTPRPSPVTNALWGVGHDGQGMMVAVGTEGTVLRSFNSATWIQQTNSNNSTFFAVDHDRAGRWVAVGGGGAAITSTNGTSWADRTTGTAEILWGVHFGGGRAVAVGGAGVARSSRSFLNLMSWSSHTTGTANLLHGVARDGGSRWVAVNTNGVVRTTTDLFTPWGAGTSGTSNTLTAVAYGAENRWVAVGSGGVIRQSINGTAWGTSTSYTTTNLMGVAWVDR